jgi:hypothetical protein
MVEGGRQIGAAGLLYRWGGRAAVAVSVSVAVAFHSGSAPRDAADFRNPGRGSSLATVTTPLVVVQCDNENADEPRARNPWRSISVAPPAAGPPSGRLRK